MFHRRNSNKCIRCDSAFIEIYARFVYDKRLCTGGDVDIDLRKSMREEGAIPRGSAGKEIVRQRGIQTNAGERVRGREDGYREVGDAETEPERGDDRTRCSLRH